MFEGLVAGLLTRVAGRYVRNLSAEQLSISVFNGDVELNSLELAPEVIAELGLPVKLGKAPQITSRIGSTRFFFFFFI